MPGQLLEFFRPLLGFAAAAMLVLLTSRLLLIWEYQARLGGTADLYNVLARGWPFDLVVISAVVAIVLLVKMVLPARYRLGGWWRFVRDAWLVVWLAFLVFNEAATPAFMAEFGVRPNRTYVEYLDTPGLVLATVWGSERVSLMVGMTLALVSAGLFWRWIRVRSSASMMLGFVPRVLVCLPVLVLLAIGVRGGLDHRPLSVSSAAFSTDPLVNDLALNSTYSSFFALRQMFKERDALAAYGLPPDAEVVERVQRAMLIPKESFLDPSRPSTHQLMPTATLTGKPNLVILVQESLGAEYFASLGGAPVATELERWRSSSFWFDNLYASGTRSARGIEAIVTGFLPTRAPSVIKLANAQHNFFTIATALKAQGYQTEFIYGGDSSFDNMRRFFLNNGFDRILDSKDLGPEAGFSTTWGVSDGDLYQRVHWEVLQHDAAGRPFLTMVFSTSNHPPFDFPEGQISLYESPKRTPANAARYADAMVARYLQLARRSPYWKNTVFLVVADHASRAVGSDLVPVDNFHIPAFVAGGPIRPAVIKRLAGQIDLLPTVLSLMGLVVDLPATGLDQTRTNLPDAGRAMMQFHQSAAYRVGSHVVVLTPDTAPRHFQTSSGGLVPAAPVPDLEREALAHAAFPVLAYRNRWYR